MTTKVEKSVVVDVPLTAAYNQWTQFEEFPRFMNGVEQVVQLSDERLQWTAEIAGVRRQWVAKILEQVPERKVAWAAVEGATNAGAVTFDEVGPTQTEVHLVLEFEPEGFLENVADKLHLIESQAEGDLERFKDFIESNQVATGAWRGSINEGATTTTPGIEDAASSYGDSGKVDDPAEREASFGDRNDADDLPASDEVTDQPSLGGRGLLAPDFAPGLRDGDVGTEDDLRRGDAQPS